MDLLAGYTLEERVRRESERRTSRDLTANPAGLTDETRTASAASAVPTASQATAPVASTKTETAEEISEEVVEVDIPDVLRREFEQLDKLCLLGIALIQELLDLSLLAADRCRTDPF